MSDIKDINHSQFGTLTAEEWLRFSVCEIYNPSPQGEHCKNREGTPYDPKMGVLENGIPCGTCGYDNQICPGHFGHIILPIPVYNRLFSDYILKILQSVCPFCSRTRIKPEHAKLSGILDTTSRKRLRLFADKCDKITVCPWEDCEQGSEENFGEYLPSFDFVKDEFRIYYKDKKDAVPFSAGRAYNIFCRMSNETINALGFNQELSWDDTFIDEDNMVDEDRFHVHQFHPKSLIFTVLPVIPPFSRPFVVRDGQKCDDDLTDKYNAVLKICKLLTGGKKLSEVEKRNKELELQLHIWTLIHNKDNKSKLSSGGRPHKCLHQRIQGKEGHIQGNIVGKRVDFTARSVIVGGGVDLKMDYLGVPECIAKEETKKEFVQSWNIEFLQKLVETGKVNRVIRDGTTRRLNALPDGGIEFVLQIGDYVERQLRDGDIVLFNRQPTLRIESMLAFRVKIVKGRAFRLGLCWTSSFNADFDGDEMNLHVPQSIGATVEAQTLMRCSSNIISGQRNSPVNGIVQDGLVGAFLLTNTWEDGSETTLSRDTFDRVLSEAGFSSESRKSLLKRAERYYPKYIHKGKLRSERLPGKILTSALFPYDFCYTRKTDVNNIYPYVKIEEGIILPNSGPLCKRTIGARASSIIHILWKDYSPVTSLRFLSDTQQLVDYWLPTHGFSMGISDCISNSQEEASKVVANMQAQVDILLEGCNGEPDEIVEAEINGILNSAMNVGLKLAKTAMIKGERNALNIMRNSGAKGSIVNLVSIAFFVGQQNVSGQRIPCNLSSNSRTLPHYKNGDNSAAARGFVSNGYLQGLSPQEVFFHSAGGREGIIATAIKSVTRETLIIIIEDGITKKVEIGPWIDAEMEKRTDAIQIIPEKMNMQYLELETDVDIPSLNYQGTTSWEKIIAVTRHDPSDILYKITTLGKREVIVADSKSLLVWRDEQSAFIPTHSSKIMVGDFLPTIWTLKDNVGIETFDENLFPDIEKINDCVKDKIVLIERMRSDGHKYLYDLTVTNTTNFVLANGLGVADTARTGYVQKCIGRKVEDFTIRTDGTVRNSKNGIVQFLYGDDGMDPKKLCYAKNIDIPFFTNPHSIALRLNCRTTQKYREMRRKVPKKRVLKSAEKNLLLTVISAGPPLLNTEVTERATTIIRKILRTSIKNILLYEECIPEFCSEIRKALESSKAQYGEMVGLIAASSIGEPSTQLTLNTFHSAGQKGKDVSLGIPRLVELLNATKSDKQKKGSCTIYFKDHSLKGYRIESENAKKEDTPKNKSIIEYAKKLSLEKLSILKTQFEQVTVGTLYKGYEMRYLSTDTEPDLNTSPIGILTYQEYEKEWWVKLHDDLVGKAEIQPEHWVLIIELDIKELYRKDITIEDVADVINNSSEGKYFAIPSPNILSKMEVYCNFTDIREYTKTLIGQEDGWIDENNINFFICRDITLKYIKDLHVSGIKGVDKAYPREMENSEWVIDVSCGKVTPNISIQRFLSILIENDVDMTRTICDDMHAIYTVLGIEAARKFIIEEMTRIISFDGTYINPRHIQLLVDSMTYTGKITAVRRDGISRDVGPNAKIMFEKAVDNAAEAAVFTEPDNMDGVMSSVMYGTTAKCGTGQVSIKAKSR